MSDWYLYRKILQVAVSVPDWKSCIKPSLAIIALHKWTQSNDSAKTDTWERFWGNCKMANFSNPKWLSKKKPQHVFAKLKKNHLMMSALMCVCVTDLPVDWSIFHQMLKFLLHYSLKNTGLVSLLSKLTPQWSLSRAELQKHHQVWLRQSHIWVFTPVQTEPLEDILTTSQV